MFEPNSFENAVTTEEYIDILDNVMTVDIHLDIWFQQDGATSHTARTGLAEKLLRKHHFTLILVPVARYIFYLSPLD